MAVKGSYLSYRRQLEARARVLRREATTAESKLWFQFLRNAREKFTRQKPLGPYVADFYCARRKLVVEVDGDSHYTAGGIERDP